MNPFRSSPMFDSVEVVKDALDEPVEFDFDDPSNPPMKFTPAELAACENKRKIKPAGFTEPVKVRTK